MEIKEIPEDLKAIEQDVMLGDYGGIVLESGKLFWFNGWIGDASDEDPYEVTGNTASEAANIIEKLGYTTKDIYTEHDYACFDIEIKEDV